MADIFVDTAGWVAHFDSAQPQHAAAATLIGVCLAEGGRLLSSNYVLIEFVALMTSRQRVPRDALIASVDALLAWEHLTLVHIDPALHAAAWALLRARADKLWSLTDCTSFEIMRRHALVECLTTDRHFEQAGFVRLLQP